MATAANFHYLLADTYGNLQQEFDAIRAQILDSDGYVREDMVDVRAAVE